MRFELRKGVKFHDGTPFTADDVVFSFGRIKQPQGTMQIYVTGISDIKKIDDYTVDLILSAPNPILLRNIIDFRIMSKAWSEKNKTTNVQDYKAKEENFASRNVNGTGPYKIISWQPESAHRDGDQRRLVGQARRQRHAGGLHADQVGLDARVGAALRRRRHGHRRADAGHRQAARRQEAQGASTAPRCAPSSSRSTRAATS